MLQYVAEMKPRRVDELGSDQKSSPSGTQRAPRSEREARDASFTFTAGGQPVNLFL